MRRVDLATAGGLALLLVGVAVTAPRWSRLLRQPVRGPGEEAPGRPEPNPRPAPGEARRTINVRLFFEDPAGRGLVLEERSVSYDASLSRQIQAVVEELLRGSAQGNVSPLPGAGRVLEVFVTARGVAYVDLSTEVAAPGAGGSRTELMAVYSLVNSIVLNFPAIRRVQILVGGQVATTLAGHVDLSRPLPPDMTLLISPDAPTPGAAPPSP
jgi:hypothetical protein